MIRWMKRMGWRLSAFALLALLVRAIIPAGFMIAEAEAGSGRYLTLELCDAHGSKPQLIDLETGKIVEQADEGRSPDHPQPPCVFAAFAVTSPPDNAHEPVSFPVVREADFGVVRDLRPGRGIAAPPPPATGPPSLI